MLDTKFSFFLLDLIFTYGTDSWWKLMVNAENDG